MKNIKWGIPVSGVHTLSNLHHFIYSDGVRLHSTAVLLGGEYHIFESLKFFPWQKRWTLTNQSSSFSQLIYCVAVQIFKKKEKRSHFLLRPDSINDIFLMNWGKNYIFKLYEWNSHHLHNHSCYKRNMTLLGKAKQTILSDRQ